MTSAADIIARQLYRDGWPAHEAGECEHCDASCGATAEGVLAALKAAGYEVVQLPEPDSDGRCSGRWDLAVDRVLALPGEVETLIKGLATIHDSPKTARERAAALLAAANAAEEAI